MENSFTEIKVLGCDFETYYDSEYGIEENGLYNYLHDIRFDPYLISFWCDEFQWVGNPKDVPWEEVPDVGSYVAMNSGFDRQVFDRCIELGIIPKDKRPKAWHCVANLSVYLGGPRSLKDASKQWLGIEVDKTMRHYMRGKKWSQAVEEGKADQLMEYGLGDSKYCFQLWQKLNHLWPQVERDVAELTFQQTQRGIAVDVKKLDECLPKVLKAREMALQSIPWLGQVDENGEEYKPLSAKALRSWLKKQNLPAPATTEAKNPIFQKWQEENKDVKVVKAMQLYRSTNALALKAGTLHTQVRPDGRYGFNMLYFGGTTGRWSGGYEDDRNDSGGLNVQNILKEEMYGLNLRHCLIAGPGKKFVISDYSQVEPRCLAWLSDDQKFLDAVRSGTPLYEAHAIASMGWKLGDVPLKKASAKLYALAKARVLALGYGAGWAKFVYMAKMYGAGECLLEPITEKAKQAFLKYIARTKQQDKVSDFKTDKDWTEAVNAWEAVMDFRASNSKITDLWERLERDCYKCSGTDYKVELPSGRVLPYWNVQSKGGIQVQKTKGDIYYKIWGGFLTENITQATARDVLRDGMLKLEEEGITTIFHAHDEVINEVDIDFPKEKIREILIKAPEWMPGLPLEIEQEESLYYKK